MPLDERKELLLELMALGCPDTMSPRVGLFNWGPRVVHAAFMILCRAEPKTSFRSLLNRNSKTYDRSWAAQVLFHDFQGVYPDESKRRDVIIRLRSLCYEHQDEMIKEAEALGFDPSEVEDKTGMPTRADSRNGSARVTSGPGRELVRRSTEEEEARLQRKLRVLQMTRDVQRQEAALSQNSESQEAGVNTSFPRVQGIASSSSESAGSVADAIAQALASMNARASGGTPAGSQDAGKAEQEAAKGGQ